MGNLPLGPVIYSWPQGQISENRALGLVMRLIVYTYSNILSHATYHRAPRYGGMRTWVEGLLTRGTRMLAEASNLVGYEISIGHHFWIPYSTVTARIVEFPITGKAVTFKSYCFSQARKFSESFLCREKQRQLQVGNLVKISFEFPCSFLCWKLNNTASGLSSFIMDKHCPLLTSGQYLCQTMTQWPIATWSQK